MGFESPYGSTPNGDKWECVKLITKQREFNPRDRYVYDYSLIPKGYSQLDTEQDAHYYGHWANPKTFKLVGYCEGDECITSCNTLEEFISEINRMNKWNIDNGWKPVKIDPGLNKDKIQEWVDIGLEEYLH